MVKEESFRCLSSPKTSRHLVSKAVGVMKDFIRDEDLLYELELVLVEACSNVVLHAYPEGTGLLEVSVRIGPRREVELAIVNWGRPFSGPCRPVDTVDPDSESGRGLYIISQIMDECRYEVDGDRNTLILRKEIEERSWKN